MSMVSESSNSISKETKIEEQQTNNHTVKLILIKIELLYRKIHQGWKECG